MLSAQIINNSVNKLYISITGRFNRNFYDRIDPDLNVPEEQRFMPRYNDLETCDRVIEKMGGLDTVFGGLGFRGLVAFCEPDYSPWFTVTEDDYANLKGQEQARRAMEVAVAGAHNVLIL